MSLSHSGDEPAIDVARAAALLWRHWQDGTRMESLPDGCRPRNRSDGYAIQSALAARSGQAVAGWKIAATSRAGQRHIGVDGPLAGRLLAGRVVRRGVPVSLRGHAMRVAEAEFAFRFGRAVSPAGVASVDEVLGAVTAVLPAIEVPDSRYLDFARAGGPQLIADMACASWVVFGEARGADWCAGDLASHGVTAFRNGEQIAEGTGANVLGDPRIALTWLVNELTRAGGAVAEDDVVITGTCVPPVAIAPGDGVVMDFGGLGTVGAAFDD